MDIVRVMAGLGNQLYHYAFGKSLESLGGTVGFDITCYEYLEAPYRLDKFHTNVISQPFLNQQVLKQRHYPYLKKVDNTNFWGFWQALKYCSPAIPILKKEIWVKKEYYTPEFLSLRNKIVSEEAISIHVRRTDGVQLPVDFYLKALDLMQSNTMVKPVYIFSDDMPWCIDNFKDVTFVHLDDYLDFELMRLCSHNIVPISTLSWWAAILNDNPNKVVITADRVYWLIESRRLSMRGWPKLLIKRREREMGIDNKKKSEILRQEMRNQIPNNWIIC
jgi:hypothetical protein